MIFDKNIFPVSSEMEMAGKAALSKVFNQDSFSKSEIILEIYWAMRKAETYNQGDLLNGDTY